MGSTANTACGIPQFTGGPDFQHWSFRVKMHLDSVGVLGNLTENAPAEAAAKTKFDEADRKAKALIVSFLANECLEVVREKTTAKEMWSALEETFATKSIGTQHLIRKQLNRLKLKEGDPVRPHLLVFDNLIRQMKTAGARVDEADQVILLFQTLPDSFDPLVTALENIPEKDLTFEVVKQRILAEDMKRMERNEDHGELKVAAFSGENTKKSFKFQGKCHKCGKRGHLKKDCHKKSASEANSASQRSAVSFVANRGDSKKTNGKLTFKLDSGSSDHLVNDKDVFSKIRCLKQPIVINVAKDGESLIARKVGEINGESNKKVPLNIKEVLYVPELRDNLMSVKKLTMAGINVNFSGAVAVMKKGVETIATAHLRGGLYELEVDVGRATANLCKSETEGLWHRRLGHLGQQGMQAMVRNEMVTGAEFRGGQLDFCDACVQGKQCRDPFSGSRLRAARPLERIHSDVCGPIDPPAWDGSRYFVSFIDDHTHFAVLYLMRRKSEVFGKFQEYEAMATAKFGTRISTLTVDQGREYISNTQREYYSRQGIQVETTVAYTPQQNGVAERFNRTIIEKVRAMLIDASVPKEMWSEAVLTAVYLVNRSPTAALYTNITPAESWYGSKPCLKKLRVFGCKGFAWVPSQQRKKLDPRSREVVMAGYAPNGYRLWDRNSRRIVIARDVKFDETCFPYEKNLENRKDEPLVVFFPLEQEGEEERNPVVQAPVVDQAPDVVETPVSDDDDFADADETDEIDQADDDEATGALPSQPEQHETEGQAMLRRSERERKLPGKFLNFFTGFSATSAGSCFTDVPASFNDIATRDDRDEWLRAVEDELASLETNRVWRFERCPSNVKPLRSKWVFRIKEDENGQAVRRKARLVVKGYLQRPGVDFEETYAPVAKLTTIRTVLAVGVRYRFQFHQMDVKTAFLHGDLREDIYMALPDGVVAPQNMVCKLQKSLYGLKQSPRCWNEKLNGLLLQLGFTRSRHDYCLYTRCKQGDELYIIIYVDDLLIAGRKLGSIQKLKQELCAAFEMTDCGEACHFLGMKLSYDQDAGSLLLSQEAQVLKLLQRFGMADCNACRTPMEKGLQLNREGPATKQPYRELLGSIMYTMLCVRPDICFPVGYMGRFQQNATEVHWQTLKRIVRYLKGTPGLALKYQRNTNSEPLIGFADADWAGDTEDRKSVSGFVFKVFGATVSWSSKKQTTVAMSSSEAEYVALSAAATEAIWLSGLLEDLNVNDFRKPVVIYEDNRGCIGMAKNLETKRSKHIDVKHHFIRDHVAEGRLQIEAIGTQDQLADMLTKALEASRFHELRCLLGLTD